MTESEFLERMDTRLARMEEHMSRGNVLMELIREEHRLNRREHQLNRREHQLNQARFETVRAVTREMVLELREQTAMIRDLRHGVQANTEGLLRVLDEMRRGEGGSPAPA